MWLYEVIFSDGDMCDFEKYKEFINESYQGVFSDRLYHVNNMIKRLVNEQNILLNLINGVENNEITDNS